MSDIIDIEKRFFSSLHSKFDTLIHNLKKNENNSELLNKGNIVELLSLLNKEILSCENILDDINYNLTSKNPKELTETQKERIEDYEKDKESIKHVLPYLISYRMMSM